MGASLLIQRCLREVPLPAVLHRHYFMLLCHAVKGKHDITETDLHLLGTRVPTSLRDRFRAVADRHDRSVSAELRQAIKAHVEEYEIEPEEIAA